MSSNRLVRSQLLRTLSDLKKSCNYPVKPNGHPAVLYVESVLKPDSLTWTPPHKRGANLHTTVQRVLRYWPRMESSVKGLEEELGQTYFLYDQNCMRERRRS